MPRLDATSAFVTAAASRYVKPAILVSIAMVTGPVYCWSGAGTISWNGATWTGVGQFGGISPIEEGANVAARGITLNLSGIDATLLADVLSEYKQGLPVAVYLALFDTATGTIIGNPICKWAGRTDQPTITMGGDTAAIAIACENRLVAMNTGNQRRYTTEDQQIEYPGDLGFSFVPRIQSLTIYWGRHPSASNNFSVQGTEG